MELPEGCIVVCCDGACAPNNPGGHSGVGYVIWHGSMLKGECGDGLKHKKYLGHGAQFSNNVAEHEAVIAVLHTIQFYIDNGNVKEGFKRLHICTDSAHVVNVHNRHWKAKGGLYYNSYIAARDYVDSFQSKNGVRITFEWIPREQNMIADVLSKEAIEPYLKRG